MLPQEALSTIGGVVAVAATMGLVTWRWLRGLSSALDVVPGLAKDVAEAVKVGKAAHIRMDQHVSDTDRRFERHSERITIIETRFDAHDSEQERRDQELAKRLDRFEQKLDAVLERRG